MVKAASTITVTFSSGFALSLILGQFALIPDFFQQTQQKTNVYQCVPCGVGPHQNYRHLCISDTKAISGRENITLCCP